MTAVWMLASSFVAVLLALAALALTRTVALYRDVSLRWLWTLATLASVVVALLWLRPKPAPAPVSVRATALTRSAPATSSAPVIRVEPVVLAPARICVARGGKHTRPRFEGIRAGTRRRASSDNCVARVGARTRRVIATCHRRSRSGASSGRRSRAPARWSRRRRADAVEYRALDVVAWPAPRDRARLRAPWRVEVVAREFVTLDGICGARVWVGRAG